jgi:hypothetical protein
MSILDPNWKYTPSNATDIRKTIARERKRLAERQSARTANEREAAAKVKTLRKAK